MQARNTGDSKERKGGEIPPQKKNQPMRLKPPKFDSWYSPFGRVSSPRFDSEQDDLPIVEEMTPEELDAQNAEIGAILQAEAEQATEDAKMPLIMVDDDPYADC